MVEYIPAPPTPEETLAMQWEEFAAEKRATLQMCSFIGSEADATKERIKSIKRDGGYEAAHEQLQVELRHLWTLMREE